MVNAAALAAVRNANIPMNVRQIDQGVLDTYTSQSVPEGAVHSYAKAFREGRILRAEGHTNSCGKGLWIVGKVNAAVVASALVQSLVLEGHAESANWVHIDDVIEDGTYDTTIERFDDLMVIQGIGEHHKSASGFADTMVSGLLRRRFNKGLPTLVPTSVPITASGLDVAEMFVQVVFK